MLSGTWACCFSPVLWATELEHLFWQFLQISTLWSAQGQNSQCEEGRPLPTDGAGVKQQFILKLHVLVVLRSLSFFFFVPFSLFPPLIATLEVTNYQTKKFIRCWKHERDSVHVCPPSAVKPASWIKRLAIAKTTIGLSLAAPKTGHEFTYEICGRTLAVSHDCNASAASARHWKSSGSIWTESDKIGTWTSLFDVIPYIFTFLAFFFFNPTALLASLV